MARPETNAPAKGNVSPNVAANGKAPSPVIRQMVVAEEENRLMNRQVPAGVISGVVHILVIGLFALVFSFNRDTNANPAEVDRATNTDLPPEEKEHDLTDETKGLDVNLDTTAPNDTKAEFDVDNKNMPTDDPAGLPTEQPMDTEKSALLGAPDLPTVADSGSPDVAREGAAGTAASGGSMVNLGAMAGRGPASRAKALGMGGGGPDTEAAVAAGLAWIARQQRKDGSWEYDGGYKEDRVASTGMALLCFLAAGETHVSGKKYKDTVKRGIDYLCSIQHTNGKASGLFGEEGRGRVMYCQGIATIALAECAGMTQDKVLLYRTKLAADFIVNAQCSDGSWNYTPGNGSGDTSIVGWEIQALKAAKLAKVPFAEESLKKAAKFLQEVSSESGSRYSYKSSKESASDAMTAVGLLSRIYTGWTASDPSVGRGAQWMLSTHPPKAGRFDMYYYYYATQVLYFVGGDEWYNKTKGWNALMKTQLMERQITAKTKDSKPEDRGSWVPDEGFIGRECGRLGTTCFAVLSLEVYYRHLSLLSRERAGGVNAKQALDNGN